MTWRPPSRIGGRWSGLTALPRLTSAMISSSFGKDMLALDCGVTPFIVVGFNALREPLFLWPFGSRRIGGLLGVEFLGGKHANFNMALWRRDVAVTIGADELRAVLAHLAGKADFVKLASQPLTWDGATNPFALVATPTRCQLRLQRRAGPRF